MGLSRKGFSAKCKCPVFASRKARLVQQLARTLWLCSPVLWAASFYVRLREGGCEMLAIKEA